MNIVLAFGTRPEATKMAPVYRAVEAQSGLKALILSTGQQRQMLDGALNVFGLTPDRDLNVMTDRQTLADLTARIVPQAGRTLREMGADMVLVHGDTSTSFCVALSAFYEGIPVGHVEAGLRSGSLREPFPEEANRRLTGVLSTLAAHFQRAGVPALYFGDFFERPEVRDLLSLISVAGENDGVGLLRVAQFSRYAVPVPDILEMFRFRKDLDLTMLAALRRANEANLSAEGRAGLMRLADDLASADFKTSPHALISAFLILFPAERPA